MCLDSCGCKRNLGLEYFHKGEINSFWVLDCEKKACLDLSVKVHEYLNPDPLLLTGAGTSAYGLIVEVWEDCSVCVCVLQYM